MIQVMETKKKENDNQASGDLEKKVKEHQAVLLKYPKNVRQVGEIGEGRRIYVEDYVITVDGRL